MADLVRDKHRDLIQFRFITRSRELSPVTSNFRVSEGNVPCSRQLFLLHPPPSCLIVVNLQLPRGSDNSRHRYNGLSNAIADRSLPGFLNLFTRRGTFRQSRSACVLMLTGKRFNCSHGEYISARMLQLI